MSAARIYSPHHLRQLLSHQPVQRSNCCMTVLGYVNSFGKMRTKLYSRLHELGYQLGPEPSPVIANILDTPQQALTLWKGLLEHGVYVNLILPPAAPDGKSLVRCSVSAVHTSEQMDYVGQSFAELRDIVFP